MYSQNDDVKRRAGCFTEEERIDDGFSRKGTPYVCPQQPFFDNGHDDCLSLFSRPFTGKLFVIFVTSYL